jgi:glutathione S-transferase
MLRLYDCLDSGNAYKVRLLLAQMNTPFERVELNVFTHETRSPEYLARNPNGRIPMLEWTDGRHLTESNAMLFYLAEASQFLPGDAWLRAQVLQWQNFEQYNHEPHIAVLRFWHHAEQLEVNRSAVPAKIEGGLHALRVMEDHLARHDFFVGDCYTIADISLYAYTHVAGEGGFDLTPFSAVRAWLDRVSVQPGYIELSEEIGDSISWQKVRLEPVR